MKLKKIFELAFGMVKASKLRSWLTMIGIVIGIASVVTIMTTGEIFQTAVIKEMNGFGGDLIYVFPGYSEFNFEEDYEPQPIKLMTKKEKYAIESLPSVDYVNVNVGYSSEINYAGKKGQISINGVSTNVWEEITNKKVTQGRFFFPGERKVVIIDSKLANEKFSQQINLNQNIRIEGENFRVIGILEEDKGLLSGIAGGMDSVYMSYKDVLEMKQNFNNNMQSNNINQSANMFLDEGVTEEFSTLEIKKAKNADPEKVIEEIEKQLYKVRNVNEETKNFQVESPLKIMKSTKKIITGITAFLSFIAGIALLVGSVGIANTMFTSVLEKTKEIGIMKSIGAKNKDIMTLFLINAALLSLVGGIVGIILGVLFVKLIVVLVGVIKNIDLQFTISFTSIFIATIISILVGVLAGIIPAKNASKLDPVEALRRD
jgi:putative ABC transport system permease protein